MMHMPAFCTYLSLLVLLLVASAQAIDPYSITGQMFPVYTCFTILRLAPKLVPTIFFMNASCPVTLLSASWMVIYRK